MTYRIDEWMRRYIEAFDLKKYVTNVKMYQDKIRQEKECQEKNSLRAMRYFLTKQKYRLWRIYSMASKEELLAKLSECVVEMEDEEVVDVAKEYIEAGYPAFDGIMEGLVDGMNKASELYDAEEYFVTDVLLCSDAMYAGLDVLRPHLENTDDQAKKKAVIGVVEGDTHDIGKNLVKIMMETAGFEMYDLGRDVPLDQFIEKAKEVDADLICMSTLMTTTMGGMQTVIEKLKDQGIRDRFKVMVGGSPISKKFADDIGAEGYSVNAVEAVKVAKELTGIA